MENMIPMKVLNKFSVNGRRFNGLGLIVEATKEIDNMHESEGMTGVPVEFMRPNGDEIVTPIEKVLKFEGDYVFFFSGLKPYHTVIGFTDKPPTPQDSLSSA